MSAEYRILQGNDPAALVAVVNAKLAQGWTLVGGVAATTETYQSGIIEHVWFQAMVSPDGMEVER